MTDTPSAPAAFLRHHGLDPAAIDPESLLAAFEHEMTAGLRGAASSLPMIPAFVTVDRPVPADRPAVVLDAGGTNVRVATVRFDRHGRPRIEDYARHAMPGTRGHLEADAFYAALADVLAPVLPKARTMGFCFSYPGEITPDRDARLIRWTKEIRVPSVVGTMVGSGLAAALEARGFRPRITVLNDTVATLLAGKSAGMERRYATYVGFILGTGTNTAYVERNDRIAKRPELDPAGSMAINVESGSFGLAPRSRFDLDLDATTADPGAYTFEKMISGAYLGRLGLAVLQAAAAEGFFTPHARHALSHLGHLDSKDLDLFVDNPFLATGPLAALPLDDGDRRLVVGLARPIFERAALFTAVNIAAAAIRSGGGRDPLHPVCINTDGTTYLRTRAVQFRSRVEGHLRGLLESRGVSFDLVAIDDSPIIGAAIAGLTH
jgi:hexokinase